MYGTVVPLGAGPHGVNYIRKMYSLSRGIYLRPIGVKFCTMVELCPGCVFSLLVAVSLGYPMGGGLKMGFWAICLWRNVVGFFHKLD